MEFKTERVGEEGTAGFELYFVDNKGERISPWHNIPLSMEDGLYTMIVEIPRHSRAKMEICTKKPMTPIKQDLLKNGTLRFLDCPMYWNYGALPKTFEAPIEFIHDYGKGKKIKLVGDNDPIDVLDIGNVTASIGDVLSIKVVGGLALIDQGEIDYKIFGVRTTDKHFDDINELEDIDKFYPGTTTGIREFFRWYKTPCGKPLNEFLPEKEMLSREEALGIIKETHEHYISLMDGKLVAKGISLV